MIAVVLSRPATVSLTSWLIRSATNFDASHSSIHFEGRGTFKGGRLIFEATSHGVGLVHPSKWENHNRYVHVFRLKQHEDDGYAALGEMWHELGASYDYSGVLGFGLRLMMRKWFGIRMKAHDTPDAMFCSELVARWLWKLGERASIHGHALLPPEETSPAGLYRELRRLPVFEETDPKKGSCP
jgi:hypothetical protein